MELTSYGTQRREHSGTRKLRSLCRWLSPHLLTSQSWAQRQEFTKTVINKAQAEKARGDRVAPFEHSSRDSRRLPKQEDKIVVHADGREMMPVTGTAFNTSTGTDIRATWSPPHGFRKFPPSYVTRALPDLESRPSQNPVLCKAGWGSGMLSSAVAINGIEKGEETTSLQRPLKLGKRKSFRKRLRSFRVRVSRIRIRVKISPTLWLKKFADAYVQMMVGVQDQLGSGGGLVMGFHSMYPAKSPYRVAQ
ncbi:hypothetical protein AXG93_2788s1050 [Marchantia polymorpha subsp. ruderalis]|uniref:Uncharacterized protein n=1 Tax=Marchantia polymorpha subsp. ruderalis TaxID=1480154 RepID=A0A176WHT5_MARPO|nr:hypothetical protein AXG93_2788s1050 [Marchantia polymorpha subsp. ruderalis]